jgi:hypothetical protein
MGQIAELERKILNEWEGDEGIDLCRRMQETHACYEVKCEDCPLEGKSEEYIVAAIKAKLGV